MTHTTFGLYVRRKRKEMGLYQSQLAQKLKISKSYLCDIENNKRKPSKDEFIDKLSKALLLNFEESNYLMYLANKIPYPLRGFQKHSLDKLITYLRISREY